MFTTIAISIPFIFILLVVGTIFWIKKVPRPSGTVASFDTRYTPNVWTSEQMDYCLQVFQKIWLQHFPQNPKKVHKIIDSINIHWSDKRWIRKDVIAAAEVLSFIDVKVWRGPRIRGRRYRMSYTALVEGLIQILVYRLEDKILDGPTILQDYQEVVLQVKKEISTQVSHAVPSRSDRTAISKRAGDQTNNATHPVTSGM